MGWAQQFSLRLPFLASLHGYRPGWLRDDIAAGLAIAAVGLPTAIAYPAIAGLPPEVGLYASIAPMMAYAFFGPSRQLIIGPDAATMTVLAGILSAVLASSPALQPEDKVAVAAVISIGVGVMCLVGKALGLGMLASLLSRPILIGFFAGISIDILIGQIGRLTGMKINTSGLIQPLFELAGRLDAIHAISLVLAIAMFVVLELARMMRSPVPGPVIVIALSLLLSWAFDLQSRGVAVVGTIPTSLPPFGLPSFANLPIGEIVLGCAAVFIITFGAGIITARSFSAKTGGNVDPNAELAGFGAANIASGLVGSFPVTASDSRTAVNHSVGGRSQIASLSAALALLGALVFFSDALRIIPIPALGAILVSAAVHLIDLASLRDVWRVSRVEFAFALVAMFGAISFGVLQGVAISIAGTLAYLLLRGCSLGSFFWDAFLDARASISFIEVTRPPRCVGSLSASYREAFCSLTSIRSRCAFGDS